jgi:threonylcarbamoyladenosine tRNA methylthiotransferase MtaB
MPKFKIITLGCKVNQTESESIAQGLIASDWYAVQDSQAADVCIVNTCAVTQKAAMQSRQALRQVIRANPSARIVATGCYAETSPHEIEAIKGVTDIVGQCEKLSIGSMVRKNRRRPAEILVSACGNIGQKRRFEVAPVAVATPRTRPFLKIQDGCDSFCTYCIVPYARGRSRSMPLEKVLHCIRRLAEAGYHEVVLTGIHLGTYGRDLTPVAGLAELLDRIKLAKLIDRVRLSSLEPLELTSEIIRLVAESDRFCRHFHIPLQSGDDGILKKMGRPYSRQTFHDLIARVHEAMPDAAIGVDTLIGFPGESENAYENTYKLIEDLPVSYLHVFPFSARPGTAAAKFAPKVKPEILKARCGRMRRLGLSKRRNFYQKFIGKKLPVLIEAKRDGSVGLLKGISSNYLPVLIEAGDELKNKIVDVRIERLEGNKLYGNPTV